MRTTKHDWKEAGTIYLSLFFYLAVDASEKQSLLARLRTKLTNNMAVQAFQRKLAIGVSALGTLKKESAKAE